jgi:hypothetical protein
LRIWLRASQRVGLPVPWLFVRKQLAAEWHVAPWQVDEAPASEVALALKLMAIEGEAAAWRAEREGRR